MAFDIMTASQVKRREQTGGFDISTAKTWTPEAEKNIVSMRKAADRGTVDKVKFFLGETAKSVARMPQLVPPALESALQMGFDNVRNIAMKQVAEDGAYFGQSVEDFNARTPEQQARIEKNNKIITGMDSAIETSKRLQENWIEGAFTGWEEPDYAMMQDTFTENPSVTRAITLGVQSSGMLALAATITAVTKSPMAGAVALGALEASGEFMKARESGLTTGQANVGFAANATMLSILESVPLTSFMKGGKLPLQMFKVGMQEGGEEVLQKLWVDGIARIGYDETRKVTEGLVESFVVGAISGGLVGAFSSNQQQAIKETLNNAKEKGVDVDGMAEVVTDQVIDNADSINDRVIEDKNVPVETVGEGKETTATPVKTRPTTPVVDGKESKQAQRTVEKSAQDKLGIIFENVSKYETKDNLTELEKAAEYIETNPEEAKLVALGLENAPKGIMQNAVYVQYLNNAEKNMDIETIKMLGEQNARVQATSELGQEIQILSQRDESSPVVAIQNVMKSREANYSQQNKKDVKEVKRKEIKKIKKEIDSGKATIDEQWDSFLNEIKC